MSALWKKWSSVGLFTKIMIGFVLGIIAGLILGPEAGKLAFLGTLLTRLLTMVVAPLVLGLLICSAADVKDFTQTNVRAQINLSQPSARELQSSGTSGS